MWPPLARTQIILIEPAAALIVNNSIEPHITRLQIKPIYLASQLSASTPQTDKQFIA